MGVRCKLLGHVHDSTEFEERQEERPNGTVLICREYQICRRCGDRKEMYRNEQVLTPEGAEPDTRAAETTTETDSGETESEPDQVDERDPARTPAEGPDRPGSESDEREVAVGDESVDAGALAGRREGTTGTDEVTEDAVVLPDSPDEGPSTGGSARENETDGTDDSLSVPVTDDAVVLPDSPAEGPSTGSTPGKTRRKGREGSLSVSGDGGSRISFDAVENTQETVGCTNCGREWKRDETSLREGDLCPGCREAYVEGT